MLASCVVKSLVNNSKVTVKFLCVQLTLFRYEYSKVNVSFLPSISVLTVDQEMFTNHVCNMMGGDVFTGVCLFRYRGYPIFIHNTSTVPMSFMGVPSPSHITATGPMPFLEGTTYLSHNTSTGPMSFLGSTHLHPIILVSQTAQGLELFVTRSCQIKSNNQQFLCSHILYFWKDIVQSVDTTLVKFENILSTVFPGRTSIH